MGYKVITTSIPEEIYRDIKKKGYKYGELIQIGLKAKEMYGSYENFLLKISENLEQTAKINNQTSLAIQELLNKIIEIKSNFENTTKKQEKLIESIDITINRLNKLLDKQEELYSKVLDKLEILLNKIEDLIGRRD